jgi:hypothetical protein
VSNSERDAFDQGKIRSGGGQNPYPSNSSEWASYEQGKRVADNWDWALSGNSSSSNSFSGSGEGLLWIFFVFLLVPVFIPPWFLADWTWKFLDPFWPGYFGRMASVFARHSDTLRLFFETHWLFSLFRLIVVGGVLGFVLFLIIVLAGRLPQYISAAIAATYMASCYGWSLLWFMRSHVYLGGPFRHLSYGEDAWVVAIAAIAAAVGFCGALYLLEGPPGLNAARAVRRSS